MSETETQGVQLCDGCGQSDNDPMVHIGLAVWQKDERTSIKEPSFHFDCLPEEYRSIAAPVTLETIEAAESGVKGDDLRDFIAPQHTQEV